MNSNLANEIEKKLLLGEDSDRIKDAVSKDGEGIIEIFVRNGKHQKTTPPPTKILGNEENVGLRHEAYETMVKTVVEKIEGYGEPINFGYLLITYRADGQGMIQKLNLHFKEEIVHSKGSDTRI